MTNKQLRAKINVNPHHMLKMEQAQRNMVRIALYGGKRGGKRWIWARYWAREFDKQLILCMDRTRQERGEV